MLNIMILYLLYHIYKLYNEMTHRSDKIVRKYMKKVYKSVPR